MNTIERRIRSAVLVVNLGTPDAPTTSALRRYLGEFLFDPRVVDLRPRWWWWLILHGVILRLRPRRSAAAYRRIWSEAGSPLRSGSEALARALQVALGDDDAAPQVALAMRYGRPSVRDVLARLRDAGVDEVTLLPLYPQYSRTTTASVDDAVEQALASLSWQPRVRRVRDYHADAGWIDALAASVRAHWAEHGRGDRLMMSFHGIPQRYVREGDPYEAQCRAGAEALAARLDLAADEWVLCFQSRVGREPWLMPYTDHVLQQLAEAGVRRVDAICPGFAVDCLETLEEVALRYDEQFRAAGGEALRYIPALNAEAAHVAVLARLVRAAD